MGTHERNYGWTSAHGLHRVAEAIRNEHTQIDHLISEGMLMTH